MASSSSPPPAVACVDQTEEFVDLFESVSIDEEDSELIDALRTLSKKSPKLVKSSDYKAPADPSTIVTSWKMNEFKYYDIPSPFPTLARGLFTQEIKRNKRMKYRIVARGYDKFFNIGEVPWTTWSSLEAHTGAPYTLTLKSNGCIIFIAALTSTKLLVTSKHSLGPNASASGAESHAQVGERWLRKHLAAAGKTEKELAQTLWDRNWTAVAELCDDSFEEHVLPYPPEKTGLHLHGLNSCSKAFRTQAQELVDAFAMEWGFIATPSIVLDTIPEVKAFTEEIAKAGSWNGEAVEGFVVRTRVTASPTKGNKPASASPYPVGSSFFFKVKFDEPYMMYRDWREVTKTLLSKGASASNVPKNKLRRPETKLYVQWVCGEITRDRTQFTEFTKGKGIIATRERFLEWVASGGQLVQDAAEAVPEETGSKKEVDLTKGKTIIVPVAIPGVGKTTIAVALAHLFGFGHVQSDDVHAKKPAPIFIKNVFSALKTHDVVIADKNNHLRQHRQQLREAAQKFDPPAHLLALNWSFDLPPSTVHRICGDRITERGDRHQTLIADERKTHEGVLWQFLKNAEELADSEADVVATMDVEEPLEDALSRAVGVVVNNLGLPQPDVERMGQALAVARAYEPAVREKKGRDAGAQNTEQKEKSVQAQGQGKKSKTKNPRYYAFLAEVDLQAVVGSVFSGANENEVGAQVLEEGKTLWAHLLKERRVQQRPHVTLVHEKALPRDKGMWERCAGLDALSRPPIFSFRLGHLVWNGRVMAATVVDVAAEAEEGTEKEVGQGRSGRAAVDFVDSLPEELRKKLHITVGTRHGSIPPVEGGELVVWWQNHGAGPEVHAIPLKDVWVKGRVKGLL